METLIKLIFRELTKIFLPIAIIELIFRFFILFFGDNVTLSMLHSLWLMLSNFFLILCSLYNLYMFVFSKRYFFYYTTKFNIISTLIIITLIHVLLIYTYYLIYAFSFTVPFENLVNKLLSLFSFYVTNLFILLLCKKLFYQKTAKIMYITLLGLILIGTVFLYYYLVIYKTGEPILIGGSNVKDITQIYILLLPITLFNEASSNLPTFKLTSTLLNSNFLLLSSIGVFLIRKYSKFNW